MTEQVLPKNMPKSLSRVLVYSLIWLQALDFILTSIGVHRFGLEVEANPFISLVIYYGGIPAFFLIKTFVSLLLYSITDRVFTRSTGIALSIVLLIYTAAVLSWTYILWTFY